MTSVAEFFLSFSTFADIDIFCVVVTEAKEELSLDSPENDWSQSTAKAEGLPKVAVLPSVTAALVTSQSLPKQPKNGVKDVSLCIEFSRMNVRKIAKNYVLVGFCGRSESGQKECIC